MRRINKIILHCSATKEGQDFDAKDIKKWHLQKGWSDIGYHYVIKLDGSIEKGRSVAKVGAHCKGYNKNSIGICYIGGLDQNGKAKDTRTKKQKASLRYLVNSLTSNKVEDTPFNSNIVIDCNVSVHGHNEFANKDCPCFNVQTEL